MKPSEDRSKEYGMATRLPLHGHAGQYRLLLFGPFTVYRDGLVIDSGSWQRSAVSLLKLLATAPGWRRSRDELIDNLWPDSTPDAGSSSLRSALHVLRRGLGGGYPSPVRYERGWMGLSRAYAWEVDLNTFEESLRSLADGSTPPEELLTLYRGEVLREDRYDDWAIPIRDRTHRLWRDAVQRIVGPLIETGDALAACEYLNSVLDYDPYDEEALRALLRALVTAGRRTQAIRRYQLYEQRLRAEMDLTPEPETLAIAARIKEKIPPGGRENEPNETHPNMLQGSYALPGRSGLPAQRTSFVGREREMAALLGLMTRSEVRLLTLTGPGGSGKTRLAIQLARNLLASFPDGIVFVSLAPVADPALVPLTIGAALGIQDAGSRSVQALQTYLRDQRMLLVLDNVEHLLAAASNIATLLDTAPHLHILVTSRASLHVHGEHEFPVPPLDVPEPGAALGIDEILAYESVRLFSERARAIQPSFGLTKTNASTIADICIRLEGLPLSLELAATRIRAMPPDKLLGRLQQRLPLLTGAPRDVPARQRTVKTTIEWSYDLLSPADRRLFTRLAVFVGGFELQAAENVCDAALDTLESLLGQSLLLRTEEGRFFYLETIREFALQKLEASDEAAEMRRRHAEHILALARSANLTLEAEGPMRHDLVMRERDNVRAALEWAHASGEIETGLRLAVALENYWVTSSPHEGRRRLDALLTQVKELSDELRAHALRACGNIRVILGESEEGLRFYEQSLVEYRRLGDERGIGIVLQRLASNNLVHPVGAQRVRALTEESLVLHRKIQFKKGEAVSLGILAALERREGNEEAALALFDRSASLARESGNVWWHGKVLFEIAELQAQRRRLPMADARARQALRLFTGIGDRQAMIYALALLARVAGETGQPEQAGRLWGAIETEEARAPVGHWEGERNRYAEPILAHDGPEFAHGRKQGRCLSLREAVSDVLDQPEVTQ